MILRKILGTSGTRFLNAASSLLLLWIATNELGSEAWGISGIILLDISLILLLADMAGNALVYYAPRRNVLSMLRLSTLWAFMVVVVFSLGFYFLHFFPELYFVVVPQGYGIHILILVMINSLHGFNMYVLLGKERMAAYNGLFMLQFSLLLVTLAVFVYIFNIHDASAFVGALYVSYGLPMIVGYIFVANTISDEDNIKPKATAAELLRFGSMTQLSSIAHMLNKRLGFYVIRQFTGVSALGVYNSGTQLAEGLRLIGQSIALVQLSRISNTDDRQYAKILSIQLLKFSVIITAFGITLLALIPSSVFEAIFSKEFGSIRQVIISLIPGVIALAANAIFSHYFSGTGRPKYNLYASLVGLAVTLPSVFLLIPAYGLIGAGASASLAYSAAVIYQWIIFKKETQTRFAELLITRTDFLVMKAAIIEMLKKK